MSTQADAPTTTEAPPPASSEALDAAAAAATAGAVSSAAPAPSPEAPVPADGEPGEGTPSLQDYVEDESLDLDASGLPDATIKELRTLRQQTKQYREAAAPWTNATKGWQAEDIETLRAALEQGPNNPEVVGEWMLKSAQALLGDRFAEVAGTGVTLDEDETTDDEGKPLGPDDIARLVEEKLAEREKAAEKERKMQAQVAAIESQANELGFGPSHPLYGSLLFTARTKTDGDLAKAAELLRDAVGDPNTAAPNGVAAEAGHTPAPPEGGTPDGTKRPTDPRAAVNERLNKVLGNRKGFNDPLA